MQSVRKGTVVRPVAVLLLLAAITGMALAGVAPRAEAAGATLGTPDVTCTAGGAKATFRWTPNGSGGEQWLDLSLRNGFAPNSFRSAGPFDGTTSTYRWEGLLAGAPHYWRVNTLTAAGWEPSVTGTFTPCPAQAPGAGAAASLDGIFAFGDDVPAADRDKVRRAVTYALETAAGEGPFPLPRVYAYTTPDELAEAMSICVNETAALLEFRNIWQNSGAIAVAFPGNFFIYAGGPHWRDVSTAQVVQTVAHEYFHVLQREMTKLPGPSQADPTSPVRNNCLGAGFDRGPAWLTEGSAELFGWLTVAVAANIDMRAIREAHAASNLAGSLKDFEESLRFRSSSDHSYPLGFLATDFAAKGRMAPVFEYYRFVGQGMPWRDAFARAFGVTIDYFYEQFEAYKANGYR